MKHRDVGLFFSWWGFILPPTSGNVLQLDKLVFNHSFCVRAFVDSIELVLLLIPMYAPQFNPIEGVFSIVKRNHRSTGWITADFSMMTHRGTCRLSSASPTHPVRSSPRDVEKWVHFGILRDVLGIILESVETQKKLRSASEVGKLDDLTEPQIAHKARVRGLVAFMCTTNGKTRMEFVNPDFNAASNSWRFVVQKTGPTELTRSNFME